MNLDFEKALTFISKDPQWGNKILAGSGLILAVFAVYLFPLMIMILGSVTLVMLTFLVSFVFSFILWMAISGYICETAHRRINNPDEYILPDWTDFGGLIAKGLKYFCGYFLYILPLLIASMLFLTMFCFAMISMDGHMNAMSALSFVLLVLCGAISFFLYILTSIFLPLGIANFVKDMKILSFVNLKESFSMLKDNVSNYVILLLLYIAIIMLANFVCSILVAIVVGLILLPIVYFYIYLVLAELTAQFVISSNNKKSSDI